MFGMFDQNYDEEKIERKVNKIRKELEAKIALEICEKYYLYSDCKNIPLDDLHMGLGFCNIIWEIQKSVLKEDYGIDWKSPAELNPMVSYD